MKKEKNMVYPGWNKHFSRYDSELKDNVVPFWEKNCPDRKYGGYFNCLDRDGKVYDTEKFMWMQWRIVWMFCELYSGLEKKTKWLDLAQNGFDFLSTHGKDRKGRYYFSLLRDGTPSVAPYSVYSECFACMGSAALYKITGDKKVKDEAMSSYRQYLSRCDNPKGEWNKSLNPVQQRSLGFYMMKTNLSLIMLECLEDDRCIPEIKETTDFIFKKFWNKKMNLMFENVPAAEGFDLNSMAGRHLNPGHVLEAMWFLMDASMHTGDKSVTEKASEIILHTLEKSWDEKYGGIFYFMDACGKPHGELQWDMKLWWVHCEAIVAALMAYRLTGRREFYEWYVRIDRWTWKHFPDPEYGEWFAYLNRRGEPTSFLKGGKWKCFFHLPRMLLKCAKLMEPQHRSSM